MANFFDPTAPTVFISYCPGFRVDDVQGLAKCLQKIKCFNVLIDTKHTQGIRAADLVLICHSEAYVANANSMKEANFAKEEGKPTITIALDEVSLEDGFKGLRIDYQVGDAVLGVAEKIEDMGMRLIDEYRHLIRGFRVINVNPQLYIRAFKKPLNFDNVQTALQKQKNGILIVKGEEGVGKTYFMSLLLMDEACKEFLEKECHLGVALWLNCYPWKEPLSFNKDGRLAFHDEIMRVLKMATKRPLINDFDQQVQVLMYGLQSKPIFIFDDVFHFHLIRFIHEIFTSRDLPCVVITTSMCAAGMQLANSAWWQIVGAEEELPPWSGRHVSEFLREFLRCKADDAKLRSIADGCNGLPRRAVEFARGEGNVSWTSPNEKVNTAALADSFNVTSLNCIRDPLVDDDMVPADLTFVGVPDFQYYYRRAEDEGMILKGLWNVAMHGENGFFVVSGGAGCGKTTIVSHVLRDRRNGIFLQQQCNLQIIIWMNCYRWREGFLGKNRKLEGEFILELVTQCLNAQGEGTGRMLEETLEQLVKYFKAMTREKRILFILDSVYHYTILDTLRTHCKTAICCAITRNPSILQEAFSISPFLKCQQNVPNPYQIGQLTNQRVLEMFRSDFQSKGKISDKQLIDLAKHALGNSLLANLIGGRLQNCPDPTKAYKEIMANCESGGSAKGDRSEKAEKRCCQLFEVFFSQLAEDTRHLYYAFLLFTPGTLVNAKWLYVLWRRDTVNEVLETCFRFNDLCFLQHSVDKNTMQHYFSVTEALHETAALIAVNDFKLKALKKMSKLRIRILTEVAIINERSFISSDPNIDMNVYMKTIAGVAKIRKLMRDTISMDHAFEQLFTDILDNINPDAFHFLDRLTIPSTEEVELDSALLRLACDCGQHHLAKIFLTDDTIDKADKNTGMTALMKAARRGHSRVVRLLINRGADINIQPGTKTALMWATDSENAVVVDHLLDSIGLQIDARDRSLGMTALMMGASKGRFEYVKKLLESPLRPDIEARDTASQQTVLMHAIDSGNLEVVRVILTKGANANATFLKSGETPLMVAARYGNVDLVKLLLSCGAAVNARSKDDWTALRSAIRNYRYEAVEVLLHHGAFINERNDSESTPLMLAASIGDLEMVRILLRHFADTEAVNIDGKRAVEVARDEKRFDVVSLLSDKSRLMYM